MDRDREHKPQQNSEKVSEKTKKELEAQGPFRPKAETRLVYLVIYIYILPLIPSWAQGISFYHYTISLYFSLYPISRGARVGELGTREASLPGWRGFSLCPALLPIGGIESLKRGTKYKTIKKKEGGGGGENAEKVDPESQDTANQLPEQHPPRIVCGGRHHRTDDTQRKKKENEAIDREKDRTG